MRRIEQVRHRLPAELAQTVARFAATADARGHLDEGVVAALAEQRLLAPSIPVAYGGLGRSQTELSLIAAALNRLCTSSRSLITVQTMVAAAIERMGSQRHRDRYLPLLATGERIAGFCLTGTGSGSDALELTGAAVDRATRPWQLDGRRVWVTFGQRADLLLVIAGPAAEPVALLVDMGERPESVKRLHRTGQLGMRGCEIADLEFFGHPVDDGDVLADNRFTVGHVVQAALDSGRFTVASGALGLVIGCLDTVTEHVRTPGTDGHRLGDHQLIQGHIADLIAHAETSFAACLRAAEARDERAPDAVYLTMIAKLVASRAAAAGSAIATQCLGSSGMSPGSLVERAYRDAKVFELIEGTTEITKLSLARARLKLTGVPS